MDDIWGRPGAGLCGVKYPPLKRAAGDVLEGRIYPVGNMDTTGEESEAVGIVPCMFGGVALGKRDCPAIGGILVFLGSRNICRERSAKNASLPAL
jgi:hypothetical protein